jgi:hypothetical protein
MNEDKKIDTRDLPKQWQRTTTEQPEEFIDKQANEKDEDNTAQNTRSTENEGVRRAKGDQETA